MGEDRPKLAEVLDRYRAIEGWNAEYLERWIAVTADEGLRGGLRSILRREQAHAAELDARIRELGGAPRAEIPTRQREQANAFYSSREAGDLAKLASLVDVFRDPETLLGFVIDAVPAGILALSLCYGAYMTEIFRSGIQSIDRGQWEASRSMGFGFGITMRKIILPQALPVIIPPTGNQFISMLKDSSLVSVIGVWELMFLARTLGQKTFQHMEMLISAALLYWAMSICLELIQSRIERHYARSKRR